jgi:hypothetical protein
MSLNALTKHIEQQLKRRAFCVVFENELERCWPINKHAERDRQIQAFAKSRGWSASIHDSDSGGTRAVFQQ